MKIIATRATKNGLKLYVDTIEAPAEICRDGRTYAISELDTAGGPCFGHKLYSAFYEVTSRNPSVSAQAVNRFRVKCRSDVEKASLCTCRNAYSVIH